MPRSLPFFAIFGFLLLAVSPAGAKSAPPLDLRADLEGVVRAPQHPDLQQPKISDVRTDIERLYTASDWQPQWLEGPRPSGAATMLVARLAAADSLGLDPEEYDAARLGEMAVELERGRKSPSAEKLARFDVALSVAAARFVSALACGRVDPKSLDKEYDIPRHCPAVDSTLAQLRDAKRQGDVLMAVQPPFHDYQLLKNGLARYQALARETTLLPLPAIGKDVRPGESLPAAAALRRLLRATGDLPKGKSPKASKDIVYSADLVAAVERFQARHGSLPDGILWSQTIEELNRPVGERVRQIERTLERWRWLPRAYDAPPVIVNIPAFRLYALESGPGGREDALAMDVLVGAASVHETPEFTAKMTHVIFRPYWEIPSELAEGELGPRAEWDAENMTRLGYVLSRRDGSDATELPLTPENMKRMGKDLRLRQRPGTLNALGLVKFMLPNEHDIYLHDTAVPGLFVMPRRDFSHGCVRVSEPVSLAAHVLGAESGWTEEKVKAAMESGEDNTRVDLAHPIPVLVIYATAAASENGNVYFYPDIYQRDVKLGALLDKVAAATGSGAKDQGRISTGVPTGTTR